MFTPTFIVNDVNSNVNINWFMLSENPNAIHLLEQHLDKANWTRLSLNPNAIPILEKNLDKANWNGLSSNPNAIHILEQHLEKVSLCNLSSNPNAIHLLTTLDANLMRENCKTFAEELTRYVFHPIRLQNMSNAYGYDLDEYIEYFM